MKRLLIVILLLAPGLAKAQVSFTTANSQSGIIMINQKSNASVGYNFSSSQAVFTYGSQEETQGNDAAGNITDIFKSRNITFTGTVSNGTGGILSGGIFVPGVSVQYENGSKRPPALPNEHRRRESVDSMMQCVR